MKYVFALSLFAAGLAHGASCTNLPAGAEALGYTTQVFYDQPQLSEVSATDTDSVSKWYPGSMAKTASANLINREQMSTVNSELALGLGSGVSSETHTSQPGGLPFLSGAKGFYVEFAMRMSSNDSDHFTALYLQTAEHNLAKSDHLSTDPAGYERWTEVDVSESGYGPGSLASVIEWWGTYPLYSDKLANSWGHDQALDFTVEHRYGLSWDPTTGTLQWYIDDVPTWKSVPTNSVIKNFNYYMVMEAGSHGLNKPYQMFVHWVRAYSK